MKKRKKKNLRNKFTDALGEEMSARENLNLDKIKKASKSTPEVDLTKKVEPKPEPSIAEIVDETPAPKVEVAEVKNVEVEEVKVDAEFEKRVFEEANNDFLEEKPKRSRRMVESEDTSTSSRSSFRAQMIKDRLAEEKELAKTKKSDKDADLRRSLTRAEMVGAAISAAMLAYSLNTYDKPLFFMAMSLLSHTLRPLIGAMFGKHNRSVQNALQGFSIVLFFGSLFFLFF